MRPIRHRPRLGRRLAAGLAALLLTGLSAAAQEGALGHSEPADEAAYARVVRNAVELHVRPATERFAMQSELLETAVADACRTPSETALADARRSFEAATRALAALDPIRFGPLLDDDRLERLAFWPDARGIGLRQVERILAEEDAGALDPATLRQKSVAVQGLTALEILLYGPKAGEMADKPTFRCHYAAAITRAVDGVAAELVDAWAEEGPATRLFFAPGPDNPLFASHREAAGEIVNAMATAMEIVSDQKLRAALGDSADKAKPKTGPFWRSGQTLPGIVSTLEATDHLFEVSGAADLLEPVEAWLGNSIRFELGNATKVARSLTMPMAVVTTDPASRDAARYLATATASLKRSIGREMTAMIGLEQGFNALDGD